MDEYAPSSAEYLYYVALLNSRVLEFYHKHIAPVFGGKYYSYNKRYLEPHPVVLPENAPDERVRRAATSIQKTHEEITDLEYRTADIRNYLGGDRSSTVLDLARTIDLADDDYRQDPIRADETEDGSGTVSRVVLKRGHTITFANERVREFVYELLTAQNKRLGRAEILNLGTPTRNDVLALMDEYESDKRRIEDLERDAERLQADLDDLILREVYDLDDEDVAVVDEFLEVW
jgi:hypothetical protein